MDANKAEVKAAQAKLKSIKVGKWRPRAAALYPRLACMLTSYKQPTADGRTLRRTTHMHAAIFRLAFAHGLSFAPQDRLSECDGEIRALESAREAMAKKVAECESEIKKLDAK